MLSKEQISYIEVLKKDYSGLEMSVLKETLASAGWNLDQINEAIELYQATETGQVPPAPMVESERTSVRSGGHTIEPTVQFVSEEAVVTPKRTLPRISKKMLIIGISIFLFVATAAAGAYFVITQTDWFSSPQLTNENLLSTIAEKIAAIETTSYRFEASALSGPRDPDMKPYDPTEGMTEADLNKYSQDQDTIRDLSKVVSALRSYRFTTDGGREYPLSLSELNIPNIPKKFQYSPDGGGYKLLVTFETLDAAVAVSRRSYSQEYDRDRINGTTVTFTESDYVYPSSFDGKPINPSDLTVLSPFFSPAYFSSSFDVKVNSGGTIDRSKEATTDGKFDFGGEVTLGDASFAFSIETLKSSDVYYFIIHKIPSLFGRWGEFKEKWVTVRPQDLESLGMFSYVAKLFPQKEDGQEQLIQKYGNQVQVILEIADKHHVVEIVGTPKKMKIDGESVTQYELQIVPSQVLPFYEEVTSALSSFEKPLFKRDEIIVAELQSGKSLKYLEYLKQNFTLTLDVNRAGYPVRTELKARYVPPGDIPTFSENQINVSIALILSDINKPVKITPPEDAVPFDDFMASISGKTKEEYALYRQLQNVQNIQNALSSYRGWTGAYPEQLSELLKKRSEVTTVVAEMVPYGDMYKEKPFIEHLPDDVYTATSYGYAIQNDDFSLTYQVNLPPFTKSSDPSQYYSYEQNRGLAYWDYGSERPTPLLVAKYKNGLNVANKNSVSTINLETKDTDGDRLSDSLESLLGTSVTKSDSDNDGYSDYEELTTGSYPLGPGRQEKSSRGGFY